MRRSTARNVPRKQKGQPHGKGRAAVPAPPSTQASAPIPTSFAEGPVEVPRRNGRVVDVRDITRPQLEAYALELGLMRRALELSDDRLRQNMQAFIAESLE